MSFYLEMRQRRTKTSPLRQLRVSLRRTARRRFWPAKRYFHASEEYAAACRRIARPTRRFELWILRWHLTLDWGS